jgi:PAS domain S-box-containing protein
MSVLPLRLWSGGVRWRAFLLSSLVVALGASALLGWILDIPVLKSVFQGLATMKANTATGIILGGTALWVLSWRNIGTPQRFFVAALAIVVAALGTLTLGEYFFGWNLGIDELLFRDAIQSSATSRSGRMSPATAFCLVLAGSALWSASLQTVRRFKFSVVSGLGATLVVIGGVACLGQLSDGLFHFRLWNYFGMAVHTGAGFCLLGSGLMTLAQSEGGIGWTLDKSITGGFILAIAIMVTAAGVSWDYTYQLKDASAWVSHTHQVLQEIDDVRAGIKELESSQCGYLIIGDEQLIASRDQIKADIRQSIDHLRSLTSDNPHQKPRLDQLVLLIDKRLGFEEQTIVTRRQNGFPAAQQMVATRVGINLSSDIERMLEAMSDEEDSLLATRGKHSDAVSTVTFLLLPVAVFLSLTVLSLVLFVLNGGVAERKLAEGASAQLAAIVNSSNDAIIGKDLNSIVTSWNLGAEKLFGFSANEMIGQSITRLIPPGRHQEEMKIINQVKNGETVEHFDTVRATKDGRLIDIAVTVSPIKDKTGKIVGASKVARDITERKRADEMLRRQAAIIDLSPDAIIVRDLDGKIISWSRGAETLYGWSKEEVLGQVTHSLFETRFFEPLEKITEQFEKTGRWSGELVHRTKDGRSVHVQSWWLAEINEFGKRTGLLESNIDTTERKAAEEALLKSEKQFRTMVNAIPQLAWMAHADGSVFWYNQRWFDYTGTTSEEMEGWGWQRIHDPESLPKVLEGWKMSLASGQPFEMEFPLRAADGHYGWFLTRVFPFKDDEGKVVRWFGTNTDLSQKREADAKIRELNTNLEQRVVERTVELEAANKELEAFSYSVSHDLRAPLRAVDGFSQAVLEDYGAQLPDEGRRDLQTIREGAQRMGQLIDDLLKFSRLSRSPLNKQKVNIGKLVGNVLESLNSQREGRQVEIHVGALPECEGDGALLNQVWVNLISNALKYTRRRETAVIEIGCKLENDENVYFVRDNGAGFDMRYVNKLFGVFQRLHRADQFEGTGVGLAIVQRIVHRHGGRIWAEATLNQGATFYFTLKESISS